MMKKQIALAVLAVVVLSGIPIAYAMSYEASAYTNTGSAEGVILTIEPSVLSDGGYIPSAILTEKAGVTKSGNTYSLSASSVNLTPADLYLNVLATGHDGNVSVSCDISVNGVGSCTAYLDGSALSSERTVAQGYHSFRVAFSGSYSGRTMPQCDVSLSVTASYLSAGTSAGTESAVRLKATSSDSVLEILEDSNPDLIEPDSDYSFSSTPTVNHGNNYPAVNISNDGNGQGGISDNQGNIDVEIHIPSGPSFVMYLRTSGNNTFQLTMTRGSEVLVSGTVTFNSGIGTAGYYLSSVSSDGSSSGYFYSSLTAVNNADAWMSGNGDDINIIILTEDGQSASRNLKMDIVFKKES